MTAYEPEHVLYVATQVAYPWRAAIRTILAVVLGIGAVVPIMWVIITQEIEKAGLVLPPEVIQVVGTGLAILAAVIGIITRIMAIPMVNNQLSKFVNIGALPRGKTL